MQERGGRSKNILIVVAVIGAAATLGAALISSLGKPKDQAAGVQQTSSGDGAINVGHDAFINATKTAGEEAAERVQACEEHHGMKTAFEKVEGPQKISPSDSPDDLMPAFEFHTDFRYCTWPRTQYSDGDGYLEIKVATVNGPGESEASGTDDADRITAPCPQVVVTYQYGHMGEYHNLDPIAVSANAIVTTDGKPWVQRESERPLPFYPATGEMVVLRSGHYGFEGVKCAN